MIHVRPAVLDAVRIRIASQGPFLLCVAKKRLGVGSRAGSALHVSVSVE